MVLDHARRRGTRKRGAGRPAEVLDHIDLGGEADLARALALDEAIASLQHEDADLRAHVEPLLARSRSHRTARRWSAAARTVWCVSGARATDRRR